MSLQDSIRLASYVDDDGNLNIESCITGATLVLPAEDVEFLTGVVESFCQKLSPPEPHSMSDLELDVLRDVAMVAPLDLAEVRRGGLQPEKNRHLQAARRRLVVAGRVV